MSRADRIIASLVEEVTAAVKAATWRRTPTPPEATDAFHGIVVHGTWLLSIVSWQEDGEECYDGVATKVAGPTIIRLTPDQSKLAIQLARQANPAN